MTNALREAMDSHAAFWSTHMSSCSFREPRSRWSLTRPGVPTTTSQPRLRMFSCGP